MSGCLYLADELIKMENPCPPKMRMRSSNLGSNLGERPSPWLPVGISAMPKPSWPFSIYRLSESRENQMASPLLTDVVLERARHRKDPGKKKNLVTIRKIRQPWRRIHDDWWPIWQCEDDWDEEYQGYQKDRLFDSVEQSIYQKSLTETVKRGRNFCPKVNKVLFGWFSWSSSFALLGLLLVGEIMEIWNSTIWENKTSYGRGQKKLLWSWEDPIMRAVSRPANLFDCRGLAKSSSTSWLGLWEPLEWMPSSSGSAGAVSEHSYWDVVVPDEAGLPWCEMWQPLVTYGQMAGQELYFWLTQALDWNCKPIPRGQESHRGLIATGIVLSLTPDRVTINTIFQRSWRAGDGRQPLLRQPYRQL